MFLYFDLGKVLVDFSYDQMLRQVGTLCGIAPERVRAALVDDRLHDQYEMGRLSNREFHEAFCRATATRPDYEALAAAASEIFELNYSMIAVVAQLRNAGYRMGILSNTCECHWEYCLAHYRMLSDLFDVHALSYEIGARKPDAAIFRAAAALAGCAAEEIFFTDDIAAHVVGAQAAGYDAVQYTSTPQLAADLRRRGLRWNY